MSHAHLVRASVRSSYQVGGGRTFYTPGCAERQIGAIGTRSGTRSGVGAFGTGTEQPLRRSPSHGRQGADAAQKTHFRVRHFEGVFESADVW